MCLAETLKKFEVWRPHLRGTPHCGITKICHILSLTYIYLC